MQVKCCSLWKRLLYTIHHLFSTTDKLGILLVSPLISKNKGLKFSKLLLSFHDFTFFEHSFIFLNWVNCTKFVPCPVRHTKFSSCLKQLIFYEKSQENVSTLWNGQLKTFFLPYFKVRIVFRPPIVQNTNFNEKPTMSLWIGN